MKKTLLFLTFAVAVVFANAQCTPDPLFTEAGIYPDSTTGLLPAYVGQSYSQNITIITPSDTVVDNPLGGTMTVTIDSINLTSVTGLPDDFDYACDPPSCGFPGGTIKCAELYSTVAPTVSDIGIYDIVFETTSYVSNVPLLGTTTQDDIIDYYYIEISALTSTFNQFNNKTLELKGVYPNPVINQAKIQFISGTREEVVFKVYNMLGKEIESQIISTDRGVNIVKINTSTYSEGIYLYSISNGKQMQTKRMIVKN